MDLGLKGIHVLVTGASGGIGLEISRVFIEQGAKVTAQYYSNQVSIQPLLSQYGSESIQALQANLTEERAVEDLFRNATNSSFGEVQALILTHATWPIADEPVWKMSLDRWKHTIDTNLTSTFIVAKEYLKRLESASTTTKDNASIILIGSSYGKYGEAGHADYAASKSAMMYGLTLSLKNEIVKIAPKGRVNSIGPAWTTTPITEDALKDPTFLKRALATVPMKKIAKPYDIAAQVVILSSQRVSGHVTGQVLMIDGGMEGRLLNKPEDIMV